MVYKAHPLVFATENAAALAVRRARGSQGKRSRKIRVDKTLYAKSPKVNDAWADFPKGIIEVPWVPVEVECPMRCLVLSDVHIPFHDDRALAAAIKYGKDQKADTILLNGDIADCHEISRFLKSPERRRFVDEIEAVRKFFAALRKDFPKAKIIFKLGNHEERWEHFLYLKAPEIVGVEEFRFEKVFHLEDYNIQCVKDRQEIRLGRLSVMHGHEWPGGISSPVNPARTLYLKAAVNSLAGHLHRTSQHSEANLRGEITSTWSTGCLCDLRPMYARLNKWNHGFAFVTVDKNGVFDVQNLRVINGEVY